MCQLVSVNQDAFVKSPGFAAITLGLFLFMHFYPGTITTHAESINSDLQRGLDRHLRHTTLNTEQNQQAIKVSPDN